MTCIYLRSQAHIAELIWRLEQAGEGWHVPLLRRALAGDARVLLVKPGQRVPLAALNTSQGRRPLAVVLLGDSGGPDAPDAFPQARRLLFWARFIVLHGAGGEAWHYAIAAEATMRRRRALVVETTSAALPLWLALKAEVAPATRCIVWTVPPGAPSHPLAGAPLGAVVQ